MMNNSNNQIVVTSMGISHFWGLSMQEFSSAGISSEINDIALMIDNQKLRNILSKKISEDYLRRTNRLSSIALNAFYDCLKDIKDKIIMADYDYYGIILSTTYGAATSCRDFILSALTKGINRASPILFPFTVPNAVTGILTIYSQFKGYNTTISGFNPVCYAEMLLRQGKANLLIAGGVDELTSEIIDATTTILEKKEHISEGSAFMSLTTYEYAKINKLPLLFQICSTTSRQLILNKNHHANPELAIRSIQMLMSETMEKANVDRSKVKLIIGFTGRHDLLRTSEEKAINRLFEGENKPVVIWIKDFIGNAYGAEDTIKTIYGYLKLKKCKKGSYALITNYPIGGNISSVLIKAYNEF